MTVVFSPKANQPQPEAGQPSADPAENHRHLQSVMTLDNEVSRAFSNGVNKYRHIMEIRGEEEGKIYKVLVIDRDFNNTRLIEDYLESSGLPLFEITYVKEVPRVVDNIVKDEFDAVLLSFNPGVDDDEVVFSAKHIYSTTPIIMIVDTINSGQEKEILYYIKTIVWDCIVKDEINREQFGRYILFAIERFNKTKSIYRKLEHLESVEETLRGIMEENAEPILIVDANGTIRFVNQPAEFIFGRGREGLIGEIFSFSINPRKATEIEVVRPDGKKVLLEMRATAIAWHKESVYLIWLHNITDLVSVREELRAMYLVDELTGLFNQRGMTILGEQQLKVANRTRRGMFFIYVNIAGLSNINKEFGFDAGDEALADTASILKNTFRKSDITARLDNGSFLVIAIEAEEDSGEIMRSRLQSNIDNFNNSSRRKYKITVRMNKVYYDPDSPSSLSSILARLS